MVKCLKGCLLHHKDLDEKMCFKQIFLNKVFKKITKFIF